MKKLILLLLTAALAIPMSAQTPTEFNIKLDNRMQINLQVCTDEIFRVRVTPRENYAENLMVRYGLQKTDWQRIACHTQEEGNILQIATGK